MDRGQWLDVFGFNPRTHVGCDGKSGATPRRRTMFQSTHPRRVRLINAPCLFADIEFQSTHPRRVRHLLMCPLNMALVFQSTHPRRVRQHIQQKTEYQVAKIIVLRKTAKQLYIKYHKRNNICKLLILRRCESIEYFAIL